MNAIMATKEELPTAPTGRLEDNPAAVYLAGLGKRSRRVQRQALGAIAGIVSGGKADALALPWAQLRYQHAAAIRAELAEHYAAASANRMLSAMRGVLKAAWKLGQMTAEDYHRARSVENVTGETLPAGRHIPTGEIAAMVDICRQDQTPKGARDAAIIGLLYACGLRRSEVVGLNLGDYDRETGRLRVLGKRNKERAVHLVNGASAALGDWLRVRGSEAGPLFWPVHKGGDLVRRRLSHQSIYDILRARAREAGVKDLSPHDFRRTFIGDLLDAGADISTVQRMAGHASVTTTARYDRRPERAQRKAAELLHFPYRQGVE